jgi:hypothetical protein
VGHESMVAYIPGHPRVALCLNPSENYVASVL